MRPTALGCAVALALALPASAVVAVEAVPSALERHLPRVTITEQLEQARREGTALLVGGESPEETERRLAVPPPPPVVAAPPPPRPEPRPEEPDDGHVPLPNKTITIRELGDLERLSGELEEARKRKEGGL